MFWSYKFIVFVLYLTTSLFRTHSFVLLTANVEDLKRIAQKFVSDSLADKIARFVIEAADNNVVFDNSTSIRNLSENNEEFDVENRDTKADYVEEFHQKSESNKVKQEPKQMKRIRPSIKTHPNTEVVQKNNKKKKKQPWSKNRSEKINKITTEQSSLEYYRSDKQLNKLNLNSFIELEKIQESDDSSTSSVKQSRKEFKTLNSNGKLEVTQDNADKNTNIHKYIEKDMSTETKPKKDISENVSDDFNDMKSEELSNSQTNLTTEIERNEFDQYFNTNYPKAEVVATSGPVELTKSTTKDLSDTDYD